MISKILKEIYSYRDTKKAKLLAGFFKTGRGQYGEGDVFWGLMVPTSRIVAQKYEDITLKDVNLLLKHKVHEVRLIGILILVHKFQKSSSDSEKKKIADFYLKNTKYINNWDLVDLSAPKILGEYVFQRGVEDILFKLAKSKNLWEQRIAIVSTFTFIKNRELNLPLEIAKMFLSHKHDLMHKATGWMLREVGKKDEKVLRNFLDKNISNMPRTTLRYAIERFPEKIRLWYLKK